MNTYFFKYAGICCFSMAIAIGLGAFGAHALKDLLDSDLKAIYETASRYHFYNTLGLAALLVIFKRDPAVNVKRILNIHLTGAAIFSGTLYLLSTRFLLGLDNLRWLGAITPVGGSLLIISWVWAAVYLWRKVS